MMQALQNAKGVHHEAEVPPLIQEITVHIDTVWLAEVFRDECTDGREILAFQAAVILDVL
jgi:hypothetical protein